MKKYLFGLLCCWGFSLAISACNNGPYEANPQEPNALNPLNESTAVDLFLGNMVADVNKTRTGFYPSYFHRDTVEGSNSRLIVGHRTNDPFKHTLYIYINEFKNLQEYLPSMVYTFIDTVRGDSVTPYFPKPETFEVKILGEEDGHMRGTFWGTFYPMTPYDHLPDSIVFENGEYYVPEKPW